MPQNKTRSSNSMFKYITQNVIYATSLSVILSFLLIAALYVMILFPKERRYYITYNQQRDSYLTKNGQDKEVLSITQLLEPNQSDTSVIQWANEAIINLYTYDFYHYKKQVYEKRNFFTGDGWDSFINALRSSGIIKEIREKKLRVSAIVLKQPLLQRKGLLNGLYSWNIKLPLLVNFESASESVQQRYLANLIIQRRSTHYDPRGVGISAIQVRSISGF